MLLITGRELGYYLDKVFVTLNQTTEFSAHFLILKLCAIVNGFSQRSVALFLKYIYKRLFTSLDLNIYTLR